MSSVISLKIPVFFLDGKVANLVYIIIGVACARIGHYLRNFGFPEDKIPGTFRTNCPGWKVKIKGVMCKVSRALRLVDGIYPYQLTADVGFLKKGGSGKSKKFLADIGKM